MNLQAISIFDAIGDEYSLANLYNSIGVLYSKIAMKNFNQKYGNHWEDSADNFTIYRNDTSIQKSFHYYQLATEKRQVLQEM